MKRCNDGCQLFRTTTKQQNAIKMQQINFEQPVSRSVDVTAKAENHLPDNVVAKTSYSQTGRNLQTKSVKPKLELEAKGQAAPTFLMKIHPRALERRVKYEEVQQRREAFEQERKRVTFASIEKPCLLQEKEKRQRIKDYVQKCLAEKELKLLKAQQRIKFLIDLEIAKAFDRRRLLAHAIGKFQNIIRWKVRNQNVSDELRKRILLRNVLRKWKRHMICVWGDRKERAVAHHNLRCLKAAWARWQHDYSIARSHKWTAQDWFDMRLSERVFQAWNRGLAQTKYLSEMKKMQADAHYNWFLKWRVLERWRRLHAILEIEKEAEERRERWRAKASELIHTS